MTKDPPRGGCLCKFFFRYYIGPELNFKIFENMASGVQLKAMGTFVIIKKVVAKSFLSALKKEKDAEIIELRKVVPEKDQLVSSIGFDATAEVEYEDE